MFKFYDVDKNYINYLRSIDSQIPDFDYKTHDKFVCGVVFQLNGINYFAPISHFNQKQKTNFAIYDNGKIISTIRFCFMFPAPWDVLTEKNFNAIALIDPKYSNLLNSEYQYCKKHMSALLNRASSTYSIGCNKKHYLNYTCCDFKKIEEEFKKYDSTKIYPKV